jgi:UDP-N-acetylenolpyruvoylglucosamine reductase
LIKALEKVKVISKEGKVLELIKEECKLKHRGSMLKEKRYLVIKAIFKLKKGDQMKIQKSMTFNTQKRYEKQPMYFGSAGSFFVWNRKKHGRLHIKYKECNLMGYRVGNTMIYSFNISFIANLGKANASDVMKIVTHIALWLVIIGALNWGLIGLFDWNLVGFLFGAGFLSRLIYSLVGLSAVWIILDILMPKSKISPK